MKAPITIMLSVYVWKHLTNSVDQNQTAPGQTALVTIVNNVYKYIRYTISAETFSAAILHGF